MNNKVEDKKSNARIAWDDFISNFSHNDKKDPQPIQMTSNEPVDSPASVTVTEKEEEKMAFNFKDLEQPEIVPAEAAAPARMTIIGEQVEITGNCKIEGDVEIHGEITGDVQAGGTIIVSGNVTGNMNGKNVVLNSARIKGSIIAQESIELDENSIVTDGKIVAQKIFSNGKTECDMDISGVARFGQKANSNGNINTSRISIDEGAIFKGVVVCQ